MARTTTGGRLDSDQLEFLANLGQQLRVDSIRCSTHAGSGHPTSSMSAADLMAVLLARHLRYDWNDPKADNNDHLIFSKGHASPLLYSMFKAAGVVSDEELIDTYRQFGARLEGHPTPELPWVDVATGSLGQGLPDGVGVALAGRYLDELPFHVWVLCGDSELAEGSIWEALDKAAHYGLSNLTAIFDVNRLGQRGPTEFGWELDAYRRRVEAFGCAPVLIDGHDVTEIDVALDAVRDAERPTVLIARTVKGKGFSEVENKEGWHGRPLPADMAERAIAELGGERHLQVAGPRPERLESAVSRARSVRVDLPRYDPSDKVATRKAYGDALVALGARPEVVALDGEVSNSTHSDEFKKAYPDRFFEMFIAEQQMVAAAVGMSVRGYVPFASTFAAFFSRAYDFVRMAAISRANIRLSGSHAGVEIGADGPSQMALEDLAAMRAVSGSTVLYPSDPVSAVNLVSLMADREGVSYIRTTRGAYPVLYGSDDRFAIGGSKVLRRHDDDAVALLGAGVTVHACLEAAMTLEQSGVRARVIDLYSVKPVDLDTLREAVQVTSGRLIVVEDHYPEGGLGAAVMEALSDEPRPPRIAHLAVRGTPGSGTSAELMDWAGISARHVVEAARAPWSPERPVSVAAHAVGPLPPVERVRPGIWSIPVPIPDNPLRYVLVYLFETDAGPYIVDAGWNTDDAFDTLCAGLTHAGTDVGEVRGVLVTHIHPDHYGLAGRVRDASGTWVGLHPADAKLIRDRYQEPQDLLERVGAMLRRVGAPPEELSSLQMASMPVLAFVAAIEPDVLIEDDTKPDVPGWDLLALWTPGHSPGHLCFYESRHQLMLSGDHVLPRITPNIPFHPQAGADPLGDFLASLARVATFATEEVLPAHEHRFVGLPARVAELQAHHEQRFAEAVAAVRRGVTSAWDIASEMKWSRAWDRIGGFMRRAAVGEAMAHLRALEHRGVLREVDGEPARWELAER